MDSYLIPLKREKKKEKKKEKEEEKEKEKEKGEEKSILSSLGLHRAALAVGYEGVDPEDEEEIRNCISAHVEAHLREAICVALLEADKGETKEEEKKEKEKKEKHRVIEVGEHEVEAVLNKVRAFI